LRSAVMPLIEEVLVKKFCQTMDVIAEGRERAEPPVVNESFTTEPVGEIRLAFGAPPSCLYVDLYADAVAHLAPGAKLYAAPQPAEQTRINPNLASDAAKHLTNWLKMGLCECEGGHSCGYYEVERTRDDLLSAAERDAGFRGREQT